MTKVELLREDKTKEVVFNLFVISFIYNFKDRESIVKFFVRTCFSNLGSFRFFFWVLRPRVYSELFLYKCGILIQIFAKIVDILFFCISFCTLFITTK